MEHEPENDEEVSHRVVLRKRARADDNHGTLEIGASSSRETWFQAKKRQNPPQKQGSRCQVNSLKC